VGLYIHSPILLHGIVVSYLSTDTLPLPFIRDPGTPHVFRSVCCPLLAVFCLTYRSTLKMKAVLPSETSADFCPITVCYIPDESTITFRKYSYVEINSGTFAHVLLIILRAVRLKDKVYWEQKVYFIFICSFLLFHVKG
jgi:hypothetical protein